MVFEIAVCPICKWFCKPLFEGHEPICINCLAESQGALGKKISMIDYSPEAVVNAQRCQILEVIPRSSPFKQNGKKPAKVVAPAKIKTSPFKSKKSSKRGKVRMAV